jgi:hypothetical protein
LSPDEDVCAQRLWRESGFDSNPQAAPIQGGANNRVFRLWDEEHSALLKIYYSGADDPRDRFGAEVAFTQFLQQHGITAGPRPLAWDREAGMAIFEFIEGRKLARGEVTIAHVLSAIDFIRCVNRFRDSRDALELPDASESCFSIAQHLDCVQRRVNRLGGIGDATAIDRDARRFVERDLAPAWIGVRESTIAAARIEGNENDVLRADERCLSPSDFGFHNALVQTDGLLRFFDFEYAGWDDPAKLICDFSCQVEVPAPAVGQEEFAAGVAATVADSAAAMSRAAVLPPVYRIKWCCILLNEFLPEEARRRRFSRGDDDGECKAAQLAKARELWGRLEAEM